VLTLAASPVSWGVDFPDSDGVPEPAAVLRKVKELGFSALELGPLGYLPSEPHELRRMLDEADLTAVGTWLLAPLHAAGASEEITTTAAATLRFIRAAGASLLIVIDAVSPERTATAGRSGAARRMDSAEWRRFLDHLMSIVELADRHGVQPVFHPHAGTFVEFADEIERLLELTASAGLGLCVDTGHLCYAGTPAATLLGDVCERVRHVHLKDVDPRALAEARRRRLDFWSAVASGLFCPLGQGVAGVEEAVESLVEQRFDGFATIEQDRIPGRDAAAVADLDASARFMRRLLTRDSHGT
jgi:inosose dehydratase